MGTLAGVAGLSANRLVALRPKPKLFVVVIAEQFRQLYLSRTWNSLVPGGFRELAGKGTYYPDCRLLSSGFTSSGLATLATGAYPSLHGIVADQWYDRRMGRMTKARPALLEATTLADELERSGKSRIYCLGMNEGPASLMAGQTKGQVFWMDNQGRFNTRGNTPEWLAGYNSARSLEPLHNKKWMAVGARSDSPPIRTLAYDARKPEEFFELYQASPDGQEAQFDLLRTMVTAEKLGQQETVDFVFVTLGSMALLGYETGAISPIMDQMAVELDRQMQRTLEVLNKTPGKGSYNLIFAAAHGAPPEPDAALRPVKAIQGENVARAINRGMSDWLDKAPAKNSYVDKYVYPFLYLRLDTLHKQNTPARGARKLAGEMALRVPGVAGYYTADGDCSFTGEWRRRFENSFHELRGGDVMLSYDPEAVEEYGVGRGVSYGSLYNYDVSVPLILYGPQFARRTIENAIEAIDLAPTLARAAGISAPSSATGDALVEAYAEGEDEHSK